MHSTPLRRVIAAVLLGAFSIACSPSTPCRNDGACPARQLCGPDGLCIEGEGKASTVAFSAPEANATLTGTTEIKLAVEDKANPITVLSCFLDDPANPANRFGQLAAQPWSMVLDTTLHANGPHKLIVEALDSRGGKITSELPVTIQNDGLAVSITSPLANAVLTGKVTVAADITGGRAVRAATLFLGSAEKPENRVASLSAPPWTFLLDSTGLPNGPQQLVVTAVDSSGQDATASVTVTVSNAPLTLENLAIEPPTAGLGTVVRLSFNVESPAPLSRPPSVTVGGAAAALDEVSGTLYRFRYRATGEEAQQVVTVVATATDQWDRTASVTGTLAFDFAAPKITAVLITPAHVSNTDPQLSFEVDKQVGTATVVVDRDEPKAAGEPAGTNPSKYGVTLQAGPLAEGAHSVLIRAVDSHGNAGTATISFVVDRTAPAFSLVDVRPYVAGPGQPVTVSFVASEPLAADPLVKFGDRIATKAQQAGLVYVYTFTAEASMQELGSVAAVAVSGADLAGNEGHASASISFLVKGPALSELTMTPAVAHPGQQVSVRCRAGKPLGSAPPVVRVGGRDATFVSQQAENSSVVFTYGSLVPTDAEAGILAVNVSASDPVGNISTIAGELAVAARTVPLVSALTVAPPAARAGTLLGIKFVLDEATPLVGAPTVTVGGEPAWLELASGNAYTYRYRVSGFEGSEAKDVRVSVRPLADGPAITATTTVNLDFVAPVLSALALSRTHVNNTTTTLSLALDAAPSGLTYSLRRGTQTVGPTPIPISLTPSVELSAATVAGLAEGAWSVTAEATDEAGNIASATTPLVVDRTAPTFSLQSPLPKAAGPASPLFGSFTASEPLSPLPSVKVGAIDATVAALSVGAYSFSWNGVGGTTQDAAGLVVTGTDLAGNSGASTLGSLVALPEKPSVTASVSPTTAYAGQMLEITLVVTGPASRIQSASARVGSVQASLVKTANAADSATYIFRHVVGSTEAAGSTEILASVTDLAGGVGTATATVTITKPPPPVVANLLVAPVRANAGELLTISFDVTPTAPLLQRPLITVGGYPAQFRQHTVNAGVESFSYAYRVSGLEGYGPQPVQVWVLDELLQPTLAERTVLLNTEPQCVGETSFVYRPSLATGQEPAAVAHGDLNGDGRPDLAFPNAMDNTVTVLLNEGLVDGTESFAPSATYAVGRKPVDIVIGDLNGDGKPELVVANQDGNSVSVLLNRGDGTFLPQTAIPLPTGPTGLLAADFNRDGKLDLAVASSLPGGTLTLLFGDGAGKFPTVEQGPGVVRPVSMVAEDFNRDGRLDLAYTEYSSPPTAGSLIYVFSGSGGGGGSRGSGQLFFSNVISFGGNAERLASADFDVDGKPDLVAASKSGTVEVFQNVYTSADGITFATKSLFTVATGSPAVSVGDFDLDGDPDISVADPADGTVTFWLNKRDWTFQKDQKYPVASGASALVTADLNGDGRADSVVADTARNEARLLFGNPAAATGLTFATPAQYQTGSGPGAAERGDFNGDGKDDVVVLLPLYNQAVVYLNQGNGTFTAGGSNSVGSYSQAVAVSDVNRDGTLDLVVANTYSSNVGVLLGRGDGTFKAEQIYPVGGYPYAIAIGDFNRDGWPDIAAAAQDTSNNTTLKVILTGGSQFSTITTYPLGTNQSPNSITAGDVNGDGRLDLFVGVFGGMRLLLGNGNGGFQTASDLGMCIVCRSGRLLDVNKDGFLDLVAADTSAQTVSVRLNDGKGIFAAAVGYAAGPAPMSIFAGDLDLDGKVDLVVGQDGANVTEVFLLRNNGDGRFDVSESLSVGFGLSGDPREVLVGDFNVDGKPDVAAVSRQSNNLVVVPSTLQVTPFTARRSADYPVADGPSDGALASGDFDGDGATDLLVLGASNQAIVRLNRAMGDRIRTFEKEAKYVTGTQPVAAAVADFDRDGFLDFAVANSGSNDLSVLLNHGDGTFAGQVTYPTGDLSAPRALAVGDFNRDNRPDLVVANHGANAIAVLFGSGDGKLSAPTPYPTGSNSQPLSVASGDLNGDGKQDIVVALYGTNTVGVRLNKGDGTFLDQNPFATGASTGPRSVVIADFDRDGRNDIGVANERSGTVGVFLGNGNGTFKAQVTHSTGTGSSPVSLGMGDFNGDGWTDLAGTLSGTKELALLLNKGDGTFPAASTNHKIGTGPSAITVGYFSQGIAEVVVLNGADGTLSFMPTACQP